MRIFGLIGYPLLHSFSEKYFSEKFRKEKINDAKYFLFPLKDISDYNSLIQRYMFSGLNVTIPFKQSIMQYLDEIDGDAGLAGAVNTIVFKKNNGKILAKGYNTDVYGFEHLLNLCDFQKAVKALILGTGGAAKAVGCVLNKRKIPFSYVSRNPLIENALSYQELNNAVISEHKLIINATPLGMFPETEKFPEIPYECIEKDHICIDLIYNPEKTEFLARCEQHNALVINGMEMFIAQAEQAWKIWNK